MNLKYVLFCFMRRVNLSVLLFFFHSVEMTIWILENIVYKGKFKGKNNESIHIVTFMCDIQSEFLCGNF